MEVLSEFYVNRVLLLRPGVHGVIKGGSGTKGQHNGIIMALGVYTFCFSPFLFFAAHFHLHHAWLI